MNRDAPVPVVAVVGGGFSGVVAAARILAEARRPLRVVMIDRSGGRGRGVAYGTRFDAHLLNVPAARMSAFPEDDGDFVRFARLADAGVGDGSFLPRSRYADYLDWVLDRAAAAAAPDVRLEALAGEVVSVEPAERTCRLGLEGGGVLDADWVILAPGNLPPADPGFVDQALKSTGRFLADPWEPDVFRDVGARDRVLLIGTGLTMLDVTLGLAGRSGTTRFTAVSRRGLFPTAHRDPGRPRSTGTIPPELDRMDASALGYLRALRRQIAETEATGGDWRDVVAAVRPVTPALWRRLSVRERARFHRHLRPYWESHRHRAAPAAFRAVNGLRAEGCLEVVAGIVECVTVGPDGLEVEIRERGGAGRSGTYDWIVNCTGPASDLGRSPDRLMTSLRRAGLIRPDPLGLGLETAPDYRLLDAEGRPVDRIHYVGPWLRAQHWEATAVPELRIHAAAAARVVLARAGAV